MPLLFLHIPKKKREVNAMRCMLCIQCAIRGLLTINGQFCGPVDGEGQTFPTARDAEIFIEYMPLTENAKPMALELALEQGKDVFAVPGRLTDPLSEGCNHLIQQEKENIT